MGVKEASIAAGLLGGAGGAGASYATNNFGYGFGNKGNNDAGDNTNTEKITTLNCGKLFSVDNMSSLSTPAENNNTDKELTWAPKEFEAKKGCLISKVSKDESKTKVKDINFELWAIGAEKENGSNNGLVIKSTLSDLSKESGDATVVSRIFRIVKANDSSTWTTTEAIEFSSKINLEGKMSGLSSKDVTIKDLCKQDNECDKRFEWTDKGNSSTSIVDKVKIYKESGKYLLFFGRDYAENAEVNEEMKGAYVYEGSEWKKVKTNPTLTNQHFFKEGIKGTWTGPITPAPGG